MAISYNRLWKLLIDKKMTKTELRLAADISTTTLAKLGKDETVSMDVMLRICKVLNCGIEDVLDAVRAFAKTLEARGIRATVRRKLGPDINAACGQLRRAAAKLEKGEE